MAWVVAVFGAAVVVRMLIVGGASADGKGFRRDDEPFAYGIIVALAVLVDILLFYIALYGAESLIKWLR